MKDIESYEFNEFKYLKDYSSSSQKPTIEHDKVKPDYLFKFYSLSKYSIDALLNSYFYASHPIELNDYLDSSPFLLYTSQPLDYDLYEKFLGFAYENKDELKKFHQDDCSRENLCKGYISNMYDVATNLLGIISLTGKENNPLMWPHYTQEKGFQIKFKTDLLEENISNKIYKQKEDYLGLYPINYSEKLSPIDVSQFRDWFIPIYYATNVKTKQWEYENEWRFIIGKSNMGVPYSKSGLDQREDYIVSTENRYVYYDNSLIEELCLGISFFTGEEFNIKWLDEKKIRLELKCNKDNLEKNIYNILLNFINENLKDKLYYSGLKYELDENEKHFIIRTKEKLDIDKVKEGVYEITRTNQIIRLVENASL